MQAYNIDNYKMSLNINTIMSLTYLIFMFVLSNV